MQEKEWQRRVVIGIVVASIFFGWWLRGFLYNWKFRLFSPKAWGFIAHEFDEGWQPSSKSDWIFIFTLLFAVPLFLYLWYLCTKVRWRKLIKKIYRAIVDFFTSPFKEEKKKTKIVLAPPPPPAIEINNYSSTTTRPRPISFATQITPVQTFTTENTGPVFSQSATAQSAVSPPQSSDITTSWNPNGLSEDITNIPLDSIELPQRESLNEDIPALLEKAGYLLIPDVKTSLQNLDFLAVGSDRIYAILFDKEPGDWLAEEEPFNGEAPLWFSEIDHRVSPIYDLKKSAAEIQEKIASQIPDITVVPFLIEQKGNIINAEEMLKTWKELGVLVSRTDVGGTEDLSITSEVIESTTPASAAQVETIKTLFKGEQ